MSLGSKRREEKSSKSGAKDIAGETSKADMAGKEREFRDLCASKHKYRYGRSKLVALDASYIVIMTLRQELARDGS
jgi:hypothetical protein